MIVVTQQRLLSGSVSAHVNCYRSRQRHNFDPYYKWWSTRAVLKAHTWFRTNQDRQDEILRSLRTHTAKMTLSLHKQVYNRCFVRFIDRFGSFTLKKAGLRTHRFAAHPRPEKLASSHSSYLERAHFGSLAHPQSYRSRSVYLECTHLSTSISAQASQHKHHSLHQHWSDS